MADLTPPASQNNTPMRPLGPADDLDHPTSPTRATSSSQDPSAINATALRGSTLGVGTPEHDVDMDEELATSGAIPTYDTAEAHGEASPDYDGVSEDEYSQSDISGDELNREPLLSDGGSDEGMVDEDAKVEDEEQREDDAELEALPATTSSDDKGKSNMDGEVPGQQPGRPKRGTRSSRLRAAASQAPDAKGAKGFRVRIKIRVSAQADARTPNRGRTDEATTTA